MEDERVMKVAITLAFLAAAGLFGMVLYKIANNPSTQISSIRVHIDQETGCEYLAGRQYGITPRLSRDGRHICH